MKTYKLTPLEELRLEKKRLNEQRLISGQRLSYQLQYLNDNWEDMLAKGVTSSIKIKLSETLANLVGESANVTPFRHKRSRLRLNNAAANIIMSNLPLIGTIAWRIARPALMGYITRQVTARIFGKRRKK